MKKLLLSLSILSLMLAPLGGANRVKTVVTGEVILAADWNNEFDNIYNDVTHTISGTWTFDKSGTPITITPGSAPSANTVLLDITDAGSANLWKIDYEADVTRTGTTTWTLSDAATNATSTFSTLIHSTSGTAAAGLGIRLLYQIEDAGGNTEDAGALDVVWSDASDGAEDSDLVFSVAEASTLVEWGRFTSAGGLQMEGTTADGFETTLVATDPTADRTVTFQDATGTVYQTGGTDVSVADGGTGASSLTDGGILLGSGTGALTALGVATNGQIPIGDGTTDPVLATITAVANETNVTNGAGTITIGIVDPLIVAKGGSGAATFTDGGILLGSGTGAFTALGVASNGQIPIGDGTTDPVLATITAVANETDVTNGAGTITIGLPANVTITTDLTVGGDLRTVTLAGFSPNDIGNSSTSFNIDWNDAAFQTVTLTDNASVGSQTAPSVASGDWARLVLDIKQDATGGRDFTPPADWDFPEGEPVWTAGTASQRTIVSLVYNGSNYAAVATSWYTE